MHFCHGRLSASEAANLNLQSPQHIAATRLDHSAVQLETLTGKSVWTKTERAAQAFADGPTVGKSSTYSQRCFFFPPRSHKFDRFIETRHVFSPLGPQWWLSFLGKRLFFQGAVTKAEPTHCLEKVRVCVGGGGGGRRALKKKKSNSTFSCLHTISERCKQWSRGCLPSAKLPGEAFQPQMDERGTINEGNCKISCSIIISVL